MTFPQNVPSVSQTLESSAAIEAWATPTVVCVLVPRGHQTDVELRNVHGVPFLRKTTSDPQSAANEAAILRLFLEEERRAERTQRNLKPFVLIVENDDESRESLAEMLRSAGVRVLGVRLGRDGLRFAVELMPDLVLVEDTLPDVAAAEICREMRAHPATARTPIVMVSGSPESANGVDRSKGPDVVLARPCRSDTILATARLLLRDVAALDGGGAAAR